MNSPPANDILWPSEFTRTLQSLRQQLLDMRVAGGHWTGELAGSALSTATAVSALAAVSINRDDTQSVPTDPQLAEIAGRANLINLIRSGVHLLDKNQNPDGGFGDTDRSPSNIATSYLVRAAWELATKADNTLCCAERDTRVRALDQYLDDCGRLDALRQRYGTDKTFVVPIMTNLAIAGLVSWDDVPALPFEAAAFPQAMYRFLQMPVVSYAVPALVAIGQTRHHHGRAAPAPLRWFRGAVYRRTTNVLRRMQPQSGGYLEATPLTSFVLMSLAVTNRTDHPVALDAIRFLHHSIRDDGCWPIDTNLATWATSLAIGALDASEPNIDDECNPLTIADADEHPHDRDAAASSDTHQWCGPSLFAWHGQCQHTRRHPFTGAEPGGWGWTDLTGAVPDGDDTPAAILATIAMLRRGGGLNPTESRAAAAVRQVALERITRGLAWLRRLQNRDGGWPTFCRGWGKLPFDRSSTDLTAQCVRGQIG
ncbi:MAG: hypothetical protein AAFP69_05725, partial [Planctomycetota bacterium]